MRIGIPKEVKNHEYRVGLTPASVRDLVSHGHQVFVQSSAGKGIGCEDDEYQLAGADILPTALDVFISAELIVKVKEPQPEEFFLIQKNQTLFTFLHLAPDPKQAQGLLESGCIAIAYETVTDSCGGLPLLAPMSEVAGRMSIQVGAHYLEKAHGGSGVLLGGTSSTTPARVVVIGGGVVGSNAARIASGMGADVILFDKSTRRLYDLDLAFQGRITTLYPTQEALEHYIYKADLVIGAVLVAGDSAPQLITRAHLRKMKKGSVLVDVSIDQGGCFETSRPTSHQDPVYSVDDIIHYCVTNMPGAVPHTSTYALNSATLPYVMKLANLGIHEALNQDQHLKAGVNIYKGQVTHQTVATALGCAYCPF